MVMTAKNLTDLVVLGILHRTPVTEEQVSVIAKSIIPDLWHPTSDVINEAIVRNLKFGFLTYTSNFPQKLLLTIVGKERFQALISLNVGLNAGRFCYAFEAMQFCFLDNALPEIIEIVLEHQRIRIAARLAELQSRCDRCPANGHYMRLWMDMERQRLETKAEMISVACSKFSNEFNIPNQKIVQ